ncbi:hypothetical protein CWI75_03650 [Kineobactrum sediminis]|uniref:Uncharacterized protein n=1 Tax=Kineobactrum sediminis TaxID=1905677 RepID=A0A2N5Y4Y9_9GAMM|nr:hypothetical protein [Kineobactrum sediminis]PLW83460.1 hypothetical protein CWI75_03650 [Kineobactrum sediminis]
MKPVKYALAMLFVGSSMAMAAECVQPEAPTLPDGASASMEEMIAGQQAVKSFQAENVEYMRCLDEAMQKARVAVEKGKGDPEANQAIYADAVDAYNEAVSIEESVAGQFNTEIREYKAANPS